MNIKDFVNHRQKCIICQRDMEMLVSNYPNLKVEFVKEGLRIRSGHNKGIHILLKEDGTYERNKRDYKIHRDTFFLIKTCPSCRQEPASTSWSPSPAIPSALLTPSNIILKSRSVGATTMSSALSNAFTRTVLDNMRSLACFYTARVDWADDPHQQGYSIDLEDEVIRYFDLEEFYHINTDYTSYPWGTKSSTLHRGKWKDSLNDILTLHLPIIDLSKVENTEQMLNKIKLYTLFS